MNRREMMRGLGGLAGLGLSGAGVGEGKTEDSGSAMGAGAWPFRRRPVLQAWTQVEADGFSAPVAGYVYDGSSLESGVPLGGLGTGYLTLEGNGKLGYCSIFNDLVPPKKLFVDWLVVEVGTKRVPLSAAEIAYWGHYPVADLHAQLGEVALEIGIRAFAPFVVGDAAVSNTPVAIFAMEVRNLSAEPCEAVLRLQFPQPGKGADVAVAGEGVRAVADAMAQYELPIQVAEHGAVHVAFAVGWYAPAWRDSGGEPRFNRYSQRFQNAREVAEFGLKHREEWLRRVLAWQDAIYRTELPGWMQDALVQGFYSLAKNSVWIAKTRKDDWWGEDGWFTHSESHTGCPIVETMVCRIHGHFALLFFFPELERTTLEAFRHYQLGDGEVPFAFGMNTSMRDPRYTCQHPLNSGEYAQMVWRLYLRTGDGGVLKDFYESAKRAIRYQYLLDDDECGLVHDHSHALPGEPWPANQFYDQWPWQGTSAYVAGVWLATLSAGAALAKAAGDGAFMAECTERLHKAQRAYQAKLWNGAYYRLWNDTAAGKTDEVCLANQLMGVWCTRVAGLPDALPSERIHAALDAIARMNLRATAYGLANGVTADGTPFDTKLVHSGDHAKNIFVGENLCAAMTFIYDGQHEVGVEIGRRLYEAVAVKNRSPWNQRCLLSGETGLPQWGEDYYSNLVIWALPMSMRGMAVREFAESGLAGEMLRVAKG